MAVLDDFRKEIKNKLKFDRAFRSVEVRADTIEEAIKDASIQLGAKPDDLDYEVIHKGSKGVLGFAVKPWYLRVFITNMGVIDNDIDDDDDELYDDETFHMEEEQEEVIPDEDGKFFVHYNEGKIVLKIVPPVGAGAPVTAESITKAIIFDSEYSADQTAILKAVRSGTNGGYVPIGICPHIPDNDARFTVDISQDDMTVTINPLPPGKSGSDLTVEKIKKRLSEKGVVFGFCEDKIIDFVDSPIYNAPQVVARGQPEVNGRDAYMDYKFDTNPNTRKAKMDEDGQINFKELNITQNVVEGQVLAVKIPPEKGQPGKNVKGVALEARDGKDIPLPIGKNTDAGTEKNTIVATCNGQVLLFANKVTVDPIMEIAGDVGIKTGNITFLGSVIVRGNVDDGFNIKASGNVEISGTVGACRIESDGDVIVSLGIMGKDEGYISAGKSIYAKFIQNTTIESGESIIVADGIINSTATAKKRIAVRGKRASIMGGRIFATEEVIAKNIGSNAGGAETIIEVGYDPIKKKRLDELLEIQRNLVKELDDVTMNTQTLETQKREQRFLSQDKEDILQGLIIRRGEIMDESDEFSKEIQEIQEYLDSIKSVGRISASGCVYPGVKMSIRDLHEDVRVEATHVTFCIEGNMIRQQKFNAGEEEK